MKKLDFEGSAPKIKNESETIRYCLWVDKEGGLYFQFLDNDATGTFSNILFPVKEYAEVCFSNRKIGELTGIDADTDQVKTVKDNNNGAFAKAVCRHILPDKKD